MGTLQNFSRDQASLFLALKDLRCFV